jgi:phosphatidylserine/phosphatidylglycerophosphate/cardiolipin synthase-like enzyme
MKYKIIALVVLIGLVIFFYQAINFETRNFPSACSEGSIVPIFSPYNSEEIFNLIKDAKQNIKVEVYEFSYKILADALVLARSQGVSVQVILDPSVYQNTETFKYLLNNGIDVNWSPKRFHSTHSKFMVVDDEIVVVGSLNWSLNAMKNNREASVIIYSKQIAGEFERIFNEDFM